MANISSERLTENLSRVRAEIARRTALKKATESAARAQTVREKCSTLVGFIREAWRFLEPEQPYVHGWHIDAMAMHLEAITATTPGCKFQPLLDRYANTEPIIRLLINVPPGAMKSLLVNILWPAWEWGPCGMAHLRYICAAHSMELALRDSTKMRRLVQSEWYQSLWGHEVHLTGDQNAKIKFENTAFGFRQALAAGSITGARADRILIDDPLSVQDAASEAIRSSTKEWFLESVPTRLNNPKSSSIVVIMQRLHEEDTSGIIISKKLGYEHLMIPMEFEADRRCETSLGWSDPREEDGELMFSERFPREVVERDKSTIGPYAVASQFQQRPSPRGGGIILREWWRLWDDECAATFGARPGSYPELDFVVASLDPAYTEKTENDPSGFTIWGLWKDKGDVPRIILLNAWAKRLQIHGDPPRKIAGELEADYFARAKAHFGLVEWVAYSCRRFKADLLLIESKATGISVWQELRRLYGYEPWGVRLMNPGRHDKVARAYAVQPIFSGGQIFAPDRKWADQVITECESFPKGLHDDLVDSATQALLFLRETGMLQRGSEIAANFAEQAMLPARPVALPYEA